MIRRIVASTAKIEGENIIVESKSHKLSGGITGLILGIIVVLFNPQSENIILIGIVATLTLVGIIITPGRNIRILPKKDLLEIKRYPNKVVVVLDYERREYKEKNKKKKIFISYRRSDGANISGRIYDRLCLEFSEENIFKDTYSIPSGVDFREHIEKTISESDLVIALIGKDWKSRIKHKDDFVRMEINLAKIKGKKVIPIIIPGGEVPKASEVPTELEFICFLNCIMIREDPDFKNDINRLINEIKKT